MTEKVFNMDIHVRDAMKELQKYISKETDALILNALVGSRILKFEIKPDRRTKHMYDLTIVTDAKEVEIPQFKSLGEDALMMAPNKTRYDPSLIKLRVRRK